MSSAPARNLECEVMEGAGAFVCGEETAMIASIEGQRGMPRPKPPFPARAACGASRPSSTTSRRSPRRPHHQPGRGHVPQLGSPASPGTKTFALTGHVANTGLIEVPFGTTLREVVLEHRRRHHRPPRQGEAGRLQGRADRRAVRRLPDPRTPRSAARLRFAAQRRRDGRLRRTGG
jgi:hypothetical protein